MRIRVLALKLQVENLLEKDLLVKNHGKKAKNYGLLNAVIVKIRNFNNMMRSLRDKKVIQSLIMKSLQS